VQAWLRRTPLPPVVRVNQSRVLFPLTPRGVYFLPSLASFSLLVNTFIPLLKRFKELEELESHCEAFGARCKSLSCPPSSSSSSPHSLHSWSPAAASHSLRETRGTDLKKRVITRHFHYAGRLKRRVVGHWCCRHCWCKRRRQKLRDQAADKRHMFSRVHHCHGDVLRIPHLRDSYPHCL
jgi:hypothetical protein